MKSRRVSFILVIALLLLMILPVYKVDAASLSKTKATIKVGSSITIKVKGKNKKVSWSKSNGNIKITKQNKKQATVRGIKKGKSILKAKIGKKVYKCTITVKSKDIVKYEITDKRVWYFEPESMTSYKSYNYEYDEDEDYEDNEDEEYDEDDEDEDLGLTWRSLCQHGYFAFVEVKNTGNTPLYLGSSTFDFVDSNNHLVFTDDDIISSPDYLKPGERGYFYDVLSPKVNLSKSEFDKLKFKPNLRIEKAKITSYRKPPKDYKIFDETLDKDVSFNEVELIGRIKNNNKVEGDIIEVWCFCYDINNKFVGLVKNSMLDLGVGQTQTIKLDYQPFWCFDNREVASYKIIARDYYTQ